MERSEESSMSVMLQTFEIQTYESIGGFPEIAIRLRAAFPQLNKHITNIDTDSLKRSILQNLKYQSVTLAEPAKGEEA